MTPALSMYQASVPLFVNGVKSVKHFVKKGEAHAKEKAIEESVMLNLRLMPDMHPFKRQVQAVSDAAKGAVSRLAGIDIPSFPDTETTFAELLERCDKTLAFLNGLGEEQIDGSENRDIIIPDWKYRSVGQAYLFSLAIPNFYFHLVTAYGILRHGGVDVGKLDYLRSGRKAGRARQNPVAAG